MTSKQRIKYFDSLQIADDMEEFYMLKLSNDVDFERKETERAKT